MNPINVLIVEDNPPDARFIKEMLNDSDNTDFEISFAVTLEEGINNLQDNNIDIILLDINLPDSQGLDTLKKFNHIVAEIPIILLTGLSDEIFAINALEKGAQDYIVKGQFDSQSIVRSIKYSIERKKIENELEKRVIERTKELNQTIKILKGEIKERKTAERLLNDSEGLLHGLFDNMPSGISVYKVENDGTYGTDYIIKEFNLASQNIEGMKREDVIGKSLKDIRPEIDEYGLIPIFKKVLETGNPIHYPAKIYIDENYANYYENYIFKAPIGEIIAIYNDVTEQEKAKEKIQKSLKEKETLLREINHRVKNNLQIIASLLHLQEANINDEKVANVLKESESRVKTMSMVHEKLYQSSSLTDINFKQYLEKLVYDILYTYGIEIGNIKVQLDIGDINLNLETAIPLGLIINELITNSVKYAFPQKKGTITIQLKSLPEKIEITISDDGIGITEDINTENPETLGLQLVKNLVRQIDGEIELGRNHGTEFKIKFKELEYKERI